MKKVIGIMLLVFVSKFSSAETISYKTEKLTGTIVVSNLTLDQLQAQMGCVFQNAEGKGISTRVSPFTHIQKISEQEYKINIAAGKYLEILPKYELKNCFYKFIVLGKNNLGKKFIKDLTILGSESETLEESELKIFHDKKYVTQKLQGILNPLIID